ncbi:MAG: type II secretion system protein, partial [Alphaproteobacteria bacterium]
CWVKSGMTEHYEAGRSMVEMLGVLAIMGVLSVGGVAMYTTAMNKHRANEILNEASKRAVMVAGQLLSNPEATTMSLAQFGDNTVAGTTFGEEATIANNKITLSLSGVEENICTQMKASLGDNATMAMDDDCTTLTFNADMSEGIKMTGTSTPDGYTGDDGSDCSGDTKLGGETSCQVCVQGAYIDSDAKCEANQLCIDGVCITPADNGGTGCTRNSDCTGIHDGIDCDSKTCYCHYEPDYFGDNGPGSDDCPKKGTGFCVETTYEITTKASDGIEGKLSKNYMNWFAAKNFCNAVGGSMISLKSSGIDKSKLGTYFTENGFCYDSQCYDGSCDDSGSLCEVDLKAYKNKLSNICWWTKDMAYSGSAFWIGTGSLAGIDNIGRSATTTAQALCK